jgi:hypothetical protein
MRGSIRVLQAGALIALACMGCDTGTGDDEAARSADVRPADLEVETSALLLDDEEEDEGTAPVLLGVRLRPDPPEAGEVVRAVARVEDGDGGYELDYVWSVGDRRIEDETGAIELPRLRKGERVEVAVTARNDAGTSETLFAAAEIENTPPTVFDLSVQEKYRDGDELAGWEANAWARDPDGDDVELVYTWYLNGRPTEVDTTVFPTDELKRGDRVSVQVVASDGEDESEVAESGVLEVGNSAPEIVSTPPLLDEDGLFTYEVEVVDADGDRGFRYELVEGPQGMRIDAFRGTITWKPDERQAGKHRVAFAVTDRNGGRSTQSFLLPVVVKEIDLDGGSAQPPARAR